MKGEKTMNIQNIIHIELDEKEDETITEAIKLLRELEKIAIATDNFEYTRDVLHETRCKLIRIQKEGILTDSGLYQVTKKEVED